MGIELIEDEREFSDGFFTATIIDSRDEPEAESWKPVLLIGTPNDFLCYCKEDERIEVFKNCGAYYCSLIDLLDEYLTYIIKGICLCGENRKKLATYLRNYADKLDENKE